MNCGQILSASTSRYSVLGHVVHFHQKSVYLNISSWPPVCMFWQISDLCKAWKSLLLGVCKTPGKSGLTHGFILQIYNIHPFSSMQINVEQKSICLCVKSVALFWHLELNSCVV